MRPRTSRTRLILTMIIIAIIVAVTAFVAVSLIGEDKQSTAITRVAGLGR